MIALSDRTVTASNWYAFPAFCCYTATVHNLLNRCPWGHLIISLEELLNLFQNKGILSTNSVAAVFLSPLKFHWTREVWFEDLKSAIFDAWCVWTVSYGKIGAMINNLNCFGITRKQERINYKHCGISLIKRAIFVRNAVHIPKKTEMIIVELRDRCAVLAYWVSHNSCSSDSLITSCHGAAFANAVASAF